MEFIFRDSNSSAERKRFMELRDYMKKIEANLCLPLISNKKLIGLIVLGSKSSNEAYTQQDLNLLSTLSFQAAVAIDLSLIHISEPTRPY
jgi:GAF domain-containing protein